MTSDQLVITLVFATFVLELATFAYAIAKGVRVKPLLQPQPLPEPPAAEPGEPQPHYHVWQKHSRDATATEIIRVYRCRDCGHFTTFVD